MSGDCTDFRLTKTCLKQRRSRAHRLGGLHARPVVAGVIQIRTIDDRGQSLFRRNRKDCREKFLLAVEATVRWIARVILVGKFVCLDKNEADPDIAREALGLLEFVARITLGNGGRRECAITKFVNAHFQEQRAVHSG